eukprot:170226_1
MISIIIVSIFLVATNGGSVTVTEYKLMGCDGAVDNKTTYDLGCINLDNVPAHVACDASKVWIEYYQHDYQQQTDECIGNYDKKIVFQAGCDDSSLTKSGQKTTYYYKIDSNGFSYDASYPGIKIECNDGSSSGSSSNHDMMLISIVFVLFVSFIYQ